MLRPELNPQNVRPGEFIRWEETVYAVIASRAGTLCCRVVDTGERVDLDTLSLADDPTFKILRHDETDAALENLEHVKLLSLSKEERDRVLWWRDHLNEVETGVVNPYDPSASPRPGYDNPSVTERRALKAQELAAAGMPVSVTTLSRKAQKFRTDGLFGLLDQRRAPAAEGETKVDPRVERAVIDVLAETQHESTVQRTVHIQRAKYLLKKRHAQDAEPVALPSDRTLRRLFDRHDYRGLSVGKATTRQTDSNRPDRTFQPIEASRPGEIVEADSTPVNLPIMLPDGTAAKRPTLTVMVDRYTRSIVSWAFHDGPPAGLDIALMLARSLRAIPLWPGGPEALLLTNSDNLPGRSMISADDRQRDALALPYIVPGVITTDQGKDYTSKVFVSACAMFGITVQQAPPYTPTGKAVVERTLKTIETAWMQYMDHYVGNSVGNRGRKMRGGPMTLLELDRSFAEWVVRVWQNTPHPALTSNEFPGRCFTPNQMYRASFDAAAGVPVPISDDHYIRLLPTAERIVDSDGFHFRNLIYDSPELQPFRRRRHPTSKNGKWTISYDPYDTSRIWVHHPETRDPITCFSRRVRLGELPLGDAVVTSLDSLEADGTDHQSEWAMDHFERDEQRRASRPKETSKDGKRRSARDGKASRRRAKRDEDNIPRPGPTPVPPLPRPPRPETDPTDYTLGSTEEDDWDAI